ncbi:MAG TPA: serine/threonine-protein kinase [Candidatus Binatia bacterium]|jgi:serine/threonine protein kinase
MATHWKIGDRIEGRWEVYQIYKGGMGIVYVVYDHEHRIPYAVKTFCDDDAGDNSDRIADFTEEALTWINLDVHENVTRAEFVETILGKPFLFLEFVSGGDLSRWIGTPRLTEDLPQVLRFAIQFCDGMKHAAAKGIEVHRDIKPRNCLITEDNTLKVTDFGLAKAFQTAKAPVTNKRAPSPNAADSSVDRTASGTGAGTCTHMAPEQFDDVARVDARADVYSFGVLLFQMITGKLPFPGDTWDELKQ